MAKKAKVKVPRRLKYQRFFLSKTADSYVRLQGSELKLADCRRSIEWYIPLDPKEALEKFGRLTDLLLELRELWLAQAEAGENTRRESY